MVKQARQKALHKPFRHRFAGVLPRDYPNFQITVHLVANGQQIDVAPLHRAAQIFNLAQAAALRFAQQVQMLLAGIGLKVGVINAVGKRGVVDDEFAVFILRGHAKPVLAVIRGNGLVAVPTFGVGGIDGVFKVHHAVGVRRALQAKIKPLFEVGGGIGAQSQADVRRVGQVGYDDAACVKMGGDFHGVHSWAVV